MADNVAVTAGSGTTIAADEVVDGTLGTVKVQFVKLMDGTLDGTNKLVIDASGRVTVNGVQSGTWTVQPGNTANTTPWLMRPSDGTNNVTVKAGSTGSAAASDVAMVVTVRDQNANGRNTPANSTPVVEASRTYQDVAASATAIVLGSTGATGDWLEGILVIPEATGAGTVSLLDNATSVNIFVSGTLSNLVPFYIPMGCASKNGAWKITTGASVHVRAFGNFT